MYKKNIKISVIVPTFNSQFTISKCLNSIINQDFKNFEIIVVDDGSTDDTLVIIENIQTKIDVKIKIIRNSHQGVSISRNIGVQNSSGKYILFVDSDDYINQGLLSELVKYNEDIIKFRFFCSNGTERFESELFSRKNGNDVLRKFCSHQKIFATPWGYLFKKKLFFDNNLFFLENKTHEDFGLIPLLIMKAHTVRSIPFIGYNYIKRSGSITLENSFNKEITRMSDFIDQFIFLLNRISEENISDEDKKTYYNYFINRLNIKFQNFKKNIENSSDYKKVVEQCQNRINMFLITLHLDYLIIIK